MGISKDDAALAIYHAAAVPEKGVMISFIDDMDPAVMASWLITAVQESSVITDYIRKKMQDTVAPPAWVARVGTLDIDEDTKGKAISMIYSMPKEDREGFVSSRPVVAKSAIQTRLLATAEATAAQVAAVHAGGAGTHTIIFSIKYVNATLKHSVSYVSIKALHDGLVKKIEQTWPKLRDMAYMLSTADDVIITDLDEFTLKMESPEFQLPGSTHTLKVTSLCKGFSEFNMVEAIDYLGVSADIPMDDSLFDAVDLDPDGLCELEQLMREMQRRIPVFGPVHESGESTNREFISPVLLAAASLVKDVMLRAEYPVQGRRGAGPVDYMALYKFYCILITEAKHSKIEDALAQNIAQIAATREMMSKKRKAHEAFDIERLPTCAIITTGEKYIFLRFESHPVKVVFKSAEYHVGLTTNNKQLREQLQEVLKRIVGIFLMQKQFIDDAKSGKQPRV